MPIVAAPRTCSVLLLAGGRGQRMGGRDKGLVHWRGRPLIAWLHDLVRPLTDDLIVSCNRNLAAYADYADRLVSDDNDDFPGPLAGIRAGLHAARHAQLLVLPCDAPKLDTPLLDGLLALAGTRPVMVTQGGHWEPLFAVIPRNLLASLEQAWQAGQRSPQRWLRDHQPLALACEPGDPRLANINTPQLLEQDGRADSGNRTHKSGGT
ncbi:molybdenum cofactor guanylyltransferase MobA [Phytopseudomonas dryadis]|uniref:Molybdenum cofactor guanylyltransferase n=1 Tax=Phytopseudomonas dryadis TaxID=2487520 RepID=A0A4Q9R4P2_9GAMM|nr:MULTISPECIES: molybdenum cofactor guanylyltransferase MobA [Pseudomonas]TBU93395.1 molybdenum cofactor guanylyltransferase MobA [Pseudomonas dryadis]TBV07097.1 molybdenum cofactor guanylyltransferase MobA [Pseudomonas dryadis]TBV19509.1 molybdenum cofactor guanylyltransferase MobA [Pseudomonas sp. FRB 230]